MQKEGQKIRKAYQRRLPTNNSKDYYFIHRNTGLTEPLLIEYGFLDNAKDANRLRQNYEKYAEAVVRAVSDYKSINYIPPTASSTEDSYTVQRGDSLYSIAKRFNISVVELKRLNNLTTNLISVGQTLKVKESPNDNYITYTVKSGDSLYAIANKYNTTVNEIKSLNNLTNNILQVGQTLLISDIATEEINPPQENQYTVKPGDSLYSIDNRFGLTVNELKNINNLTSDILQIGQVLNLSSENISTDDYITYIVKPGDTLFSISNKYGTSVDSIKELNNLTNNLLTVNQQLSILVK